MQDVTFKRVVYCFIAFTAAFCLISWAIAVGIRVATPTKDMFCSLFNLCRFC